MCSNLTTKYLSLSKATLQKEMNQSCGLNVSKSVDKSVASLWGIYI